MMSKKDGKDGRSNNQPPIETRFKKGQSGNPKGRPKGAKNKEYKLSASRFRQAFYDEAYKLVDITEHGEKQKAFLIDVIIKQLAGSAAKGNLKAGKLYLDYLNTATIIDDQLRGEFVVGWLDLREEVMNAEQNSGSLEHMRVMYRYYMFKKKMRALEGKDAWLIEPCEPRDNRDWREFLKKLHWLEKNPNDLTKWPFDLPSDRDDIDTE